MSRFYWWRRYPKKKKFNPKHAHKLKPLVLQQIEHGDFDESDYKRQANEEFKTRDKELKAFVDSYTGTTPEQDHRYLEIERRYRKRYNKLMKDYDWEEGNILLDFKLALIDHFEVDVWDKCLSKAFDLDTNGAESFYFLYSKLSKQTKEQYA
jgi:hypothetical protein|tara:strand:+ start:1582 stop:2037 length:456 start_codon:yes stop_codon:yes gene_type:complete